VLKRTIPGCESMARLTATEFAGHVTISLGPLNAGFDGRISLSELNPPLSYRISAEAHGSIAGSAAGSARVRLIDIQGGSILHYEAETEIGGRLATIGAKFVRGTATRYADKFFARFAKAMEERAAALLSP
jgi:carbon monoxide dehydrogenase subunit G